MLVVNAYNLEVIDSGAENDQIETEANQYLDWSELDPFSQQGKY